MAKGELPGCSRRVSMPADNPCDPFHVSRGRSPMIAARYGIRRNTVA